MSLTKNLSSLVEPATPNRHCLKSFLHSPVINMSANIMTKTFYKFSSDSQSLSKLSKRHLKLHCLF